MTWGQVAKPSAACSGISKSSGRANQTFLRFCTPSPQRKEGKKSIHNKGFAWLTKEESALETQINPQ
jgi:hypothetical protein